MEERKSRRRSLRNLRRSSSNWVVPTQAILQGIESNSENVLTIDSAYGSAWFGENTMHNIITYNQARSSPEIGTKSFFPSIDACAEDDAALPAKVMKNSDTDSSPFVMPSSKPLAETQTGNRMECEKLGNIFAFNTNKSQKLVPMSVGTKSPSTLNTPLFLHKKNNKEENTVSLNTSLKVSFNKHNKNTSSLNTSLNVTLKKQNRNSATQKTKSQKKAEKKCDPPKYKIHQTKSNSFMGTKPNFLKTTQSFSLKHSSVNHLSPKKSSASAESLKTPTFMKFQTQSTAGRSNSPLTESESKPYVGSVFQNLISNASPYRSDFKAQNGLLNENVKPKDRKRLSLRKSIIESGPLLAESGKTSMVAKNGMDVELISGYVSVHRSANIVSTINSEMDTVVLGHDSSVNRAEDNGDSLNNCIYDIEMTEEFLKSFDLPFFPSNSIGGADVHGKERDLNKSLRRSSRYFSAHEMPLARPSFEEETESEASPKTSLDESSPNVFSKEGAKVISLAPFDSHDKLICSKERNFQNIVSMPVSGVESHPFINSAEDPACGYAELKTEQEKLINQIAGSEHMFFSEPNTMLMEDLMNGFTNMTMAETIKSCEHIPTDEMMASENISLDVNGNKNHNIPSDANSLISPTDIQGEHPGIVIQKFDEETFKDISKDSVEMAECSDKNTSHNVESEIEMKEMVVSSDFVDSENIDSDSSTGRRSLRSRKSWDFSQSSSSLEAKTARKRNSEGVVSNRKGTLKETSEDLPSPLRNKGRKEISPGLRDLYLNKLYDPPKAKSWETIKESPKDDSSLFTKQKSKRFLLFEAGVTTAKLQRRHKKAVEIKRKVGSQNVTLSDEEFRRKLLDVQLLLDDLP
ncbi:hypothetical protein BgiBS90_032607 [Biomphalaria glabrata]|nr:hypothetical protein BgiBS90_032607 [Biomphalaria glabrata]